MFNTKRLDLAIKFATKAHEGQYRKTEKISYISHPLTVALYLTDALKDADFPEKTKENMVVAAILHDVWEDTDHDLNDIEEAFGKDVRNLVEWASEPDKTKTWQERKQHTIDAVKHAPIEAKYIVCADKTHNLTSIMNDYEKMGDEIWKSFRMDVKSQEWYFREVAKSLVYSLEHPPEFFVQYQKLVDESFKRIKE
ncbi:MAG: HD domain-containing protein [Bacillaceae bacterium]|nr:HD domain-containing protein [Bacillaceae bacterium]